MLNFNMNVADMERIRVRMQAKWRPAHCKTSTQKAEKIAKNQ